MDNEIIHKDKIASELKRAIRNINRNLYEWKGKKAGKTNFSISHTEVYALTRNWIIRCLRSIMDAATVDRIFKGGHVFIQVDEIDMCINKISVTFHSSYRAHYAQAALIEEILRETKFESLRYNPTDYHMDGITLSEERFDPEFSSTLNNLENFKF